MRSLRSTEGYFLLDHSASPGVPDELLVAQGLPPGVGQERFESATFTCSHCQVIVILNPDRSRSRGFCRKCEHYVCDHCEAQRVATGECYPFIARASDLLEKIDKDGSEVLQSPTILIP